MIRRSGTVLIALVVLAMTVPVLAGDIVTVPTANQLKQGELDIAYYYIDLKAPAGTPQHVQVQTLYFGITDSLEVDLHRYDIDIAGDATILNASLLLMQETAVTPNVVVGGRNILGSKVGGVPGSDKTSWFLAAAQTLNPPVSGPPTFPIVRVHAGLGTSDRTLLNAERHKGLFGGVQALLAPQIGAVVLHDARDLITGVTYTPGNTGITLKGGTFGEHWWVGISWAN